MAAGTKESSTAVAGYHASRSVTKGPAGLLPINSARLQSPTTDSDKVSHCSRYQYYPKSACRPTDIGSWHTSNMVFRFLRYVVCLDLWTHRTARQQ